MPILKKTLVVSLTALTLVSGCQWQNRSGTQKAELAALGSPQNASELVQAVQRAEADGKRIKMTGSAVSFSDVAITGNQQYLLDSKKLNKPLFLDWGQMKDSPNKHLYARVHSGIKIADLNTHLESRGLSIPNAGGWDGQTLVGVMMTATHGSGLNYGPMADFVESLQVVVEGGKVLQVEPTNGITDPAKFKPYLSENQNIPVTLIQDDDTFHAMRVSLGSMGIVYSATLKATDFFWIKERREVKTWAEVKKPGGFLDLVTSGRADELRHPDHPEWGAPEFYEFQYNPYATEKNPNHNVLLTMRWKIDPTLPENQPLKAPLTRGQFGNETSSFLTTVIEKIIAAIVEGHPEIIPGFTDNILNLQSEKDRVYQNKAYKVFNIGVVNNTEALGIELAADIKDTQKIVEKTFELVDRYLTEQKRVITVPVAVRFVKKSNDFIAMQNRVDDQNNPVDSVMFEFINLQDISYSEEILIDIQQELAKLGARPHWGLTLVNDPMVQGEQHAIDDYGQNWFKWKRKLNQYNAKGTFDGRFTDRLGISK